MSKNKATLHFICGKLGSGKTTLAKEIADQQNAIFISEDIWLSQLFPDAIKTFEDYLLYSKRVKTVISAHVIELLQHSVSVVFDFAGNRPADRDWVKSVFESAQVAHLLHYIVAPDDLCRAQFKKRNLNLPKGSKIITDQEFDMITQYFVPPEQNEEYCVEYHYRENDGEI